MRPRPVRTELHLFHARAQAFCSHLAVTHFCKSLAVEWKDFARVNVVSPGFFDTGMGAATEEIQKIAYEFAALGRQGNPKELKGVSTRYSTRAMFSDDDFIDLPLPC